MANEEQGVQSTSGKKLVLKKKVTQNLKLSFSSLYQKSGNLKQHQRLLESIRAAIMEFICPRYPDLFRIS